MEDSPPRYEIEGPEFLLHAFASWEAGVDAVRRLMVQALPETEADRLGATSYWSWVLFTHRTTWRLMTTEREIVGFWHYMPLTDAAFLDAKEGRFCDAMLAPEDFVTIDAPGAYNIYISTMVIADAHRGFSGSARLIGSFAAHIAERARQGVFAAELCAYALTQPGAAFARFLGMRPLGISQDGEERIYYMPGPEIATRGLLRRDPVIQRLYAAQFGEA